MQNYPKLLAKTYNIRTFGCQMNLHDTERVSGLLEECGCIEVASPEEADIVVYMTCSVRENADLRLYGQVSRMVSAPQPPSGRRIVAIGGCIAQRDGEKIREHIPNVDVVFGTQALASLPYLISEALSDDAGGLKSDVAEHKGSFSTDLPSKRDQNFHAWVPIMTGCNNFCSFCIVPHVRGRERSRMIESVESECLELVKDGVKEITLLGQNVNSYGRDLYRKPRFAELLRRVGDTGIERIRFTSSHPKDLSGETIQAMAEVPAVMPQLHLALQSGSNRVLKAMRRTYTREAFIKIVHDLKERIPNLALSTDIIVGFPGETEKDFQDTCSLYEEVRFSSAYTFIYSKRPGTSAALIEDNTPHEVIQDRFERLKLIVDRIAHEENQKELGQVVSVLVEGSSKRDAQVMMGRSPKNQLVHFPLETGKTPQDYIGSFVPVFVEEARTWYLRGRVAGAVLASERKGTLLEQAQSAQVADDEATRAADRASVGSPAAREAQEASQSQVSDQVAQAS